ncbi:MAG: hypothetical protein QXH95_05145 [Thermoplasmata archaeon]
MLAIKYIGQILIELIPEASNAYEALDIFSTRLYKKIGLKDKANIDNKDDVELYLFLQGYRSEIANMVYKEELNKR